MFRFPVHIVTPEEEEEARDTWKWIGYIFIGLIGLIFFGVVAFTCLLILIKMFGG